MIKELKDLGYVLYSKAKNSKGQWEHRYVVYPMPYKDFQKMFPERDKPRVDYPVQVNAPIITNTDLTRNELKQQPLTPSSEVVVVSLEEKIKQKHIEIAQAMALYIINFSKNRGDHWKLSTNFFMELLSRNEN